MENERKSRGSFVDIRRKSLTFTNIFSDDIKEQSNIELPKHSMKTYLESLMKEKQGWRNVLRERKILCKSVEGKYKFEPLTITKHDIDKYVSPDNQKFLESKPDYFEIAKSVKKYIDAVNFLNKYKLDIIDYYDKTCNELEINDKLLVDEMCADTLCEICNIKNCKKGEHEFVN